MGAILSAALLLPASAGAAKLHVAKGRLLADGTALISGKLAGRTPRSLVLSKDSRYSAGDVLLGAAVKKARGHRFTAWVSVPESSARGRLVLLGCRRAKPSRRGCRPLGRVRVSAAAPLRLATPVLDGAHVATGVIGLRGGSLTATAADGTTYTLTIPADDAVETPVTLTPVSTLNPSGGLGPLIHGVMIEPLGDAPPGATLTINSPGAPPAKARVAAFGGADPSGAAFLLPTRPGQSTTIALTNFGGYGIVAAPSAGASAARTAAGPVACPGAGAARNNAAARAASSGSRPLISCVTAAEVLNQWSKIVVESQLDRKTFEEGAEAILRAVEGESAPVLSRPPTEEGLAELSQAETIALGIYRQTELLGTGARSLALGTMSQIIRYSEELYRKLCTSPTPNSAVVEDYTISLIGQARQAALLGIQESGNWQDTVEKCLAKLHLRVSVANKVENHYAPAGTGMAAGASLKAKAEIISKPSEGPLGPRYAINGGNPKLEFESASAALEAPPPGVTASVTAKAGTLALEGGVFLAGHRRVRCDKNRHFVVEHFDYLFIQPYGLWNDNETVTVAGGSIEVPYTFGFAADGWGERYPTKVPTSAPLDPTNYVVMRVSPVKPEGTDDWLPGVGPQATKAASGSCVVGTSVNLQECSSYSFNATFEGEGLPG